MGVGRCKDFKNEDHGFSLQKVTLALHEVEDDAAVGIEQIVKIRTIILVDHSEVDQMVKVHQVLLHVGVVWSLLQAVPNELVKAAFESELFFWTKLRLILLLNVISEHLNILNSHQLIKHLSSHPMSFLTILLDVILKIFAKDTFRANIVNLEEVLFIELLMT